MYINRIQGSGQARRQAPPYRPLNLAFASSSLLLLLAFILLLILILALHHHHLLLLLASRVVDGGVTATGVLSRERGNLITISITLY